MVTKHSFFQKQGPTLEILEEIASRYSARSRAYAALVSGAIALDAVVRYADYRDLENGRDGRRRGRLEKRSIFSYGQPDARGNGESQRLGQARRKIQRSLSILAKVAEYYEIGSEELGAISVVAFALLRVAADDQCLLGYCRMRSDFGKPLTVRQRNHLRNLGIKV